MFTYKVLKENYSTQEIEFYDIGPSIQKHFETFPFGLSRKDFSNKLETYLMSHYWCKCEAEVIVSNWPNGTFKRKIDIYEQIKSNWKLFITEAYSEYWKYHIKLKEE